MKLKLPLWTLDSGLELVRFLQPLTRDYGYHLALGGGVLNNGLSHKDLDLYFLPLDDRDTYPDDEALVAFLNTLWGGGESLIDARYNSKHYKHKRKYVVESARVDVFIL